MSKWILGLVAVALLAVFVVRQRNGVKTSYVNGLATYSALPNREFFFARDCYIFKLKDRDTVWPLVAAHASVPDLPEAVEEKNIGAALPGVRILDVVRAGARFKIISVRRDESRHGTFITFEILFFDAPDRAYPRLDSFYLLDHEPEKAGAPPEFVESYAVPRVRK